MIIFFDTCTDLFNTIDNIKALNQSLHFKNFISRREEYLKSLSNLPENWIDGNSIKPSQTAINNSISILHYLGDYVLGNSLVGDVLLVMSPSPNGLISFQVKKVDDYILMAIGDAGVELEICKDESFESLPTININNLSLLDEYLGYLVNGK